MNGRQELKNAYANLMGSYPHETFVTMRFERERVTDEHALKCCLEFVRDVGKNYLTVVAGWGVLNRLQHPHCHMLLFGKTHPINSLQRSEVNRLWRYGSAHAIPYLDKGACEYTALNMTFNNPDKYFFMPFGMRILKQYQCGGVIERSTCEVKLK